MIENKTYKILYTLGYPHVYAGSQRQLAELIRQLPENIEATILLSREGIVAKMYREMNFRVVIIDPGDDLNVFGKKIQGYSWWKKASLIFPFFDYNKNILKFLKKEKFDLIHAGDPRSVLLMSRAVRQSRIRMICQLHTERGISSFFWNWFERLPEKIVLISNFAKANLGAAARAKSMVIYPGVPEMKLGGLQLNWLKNIRTKYTIIGVFSTVIPFKGYHHLFDAFKILNQKGHLKNVIVLCLGDFIEEEKLYQNWLFDKLKQSELENITFTGWQQYPYDFLEYVDIMVLPSVKKEILNIGEKSREVRGSEGFPTVNLEAMSKGIPVVATDVASVSEQVEDGITGYVIPPSDSAALAIALEKLIINKKLREEMGEKGRERVEQLFSTEEYARNYLKLYQDLLG